MEGWNCGMMEEWVKGEDSRQNTEETPHREDTKVPQLNGPAFSGNSTGQAKTRKKKGWGAFVIGLLTLDIFFCLLSSPSFHLSIIPFFQYPMITITPS
jgi:hypothetical protein